MSAQRVTRLSIHSNMLASDQPARSASSDAMSQAGASEHIAGGEPSSPTRPLAQSGPSGCTHSALLALNRIRTTYIRAIQWHAHSTRLQFDSVRFDSTTGNANGTKGKRFSAAVSTSNKSMGMSLHHPLTRFHDIKQKLNLADCLKCLSNDVRVAI